VLSGQHNHPPAAILAPTTLKGGHKVTTSREGAYGQAQHFGKYRGYVIDNNDPQAMARIRATVPAVLGDAPTAWALPCLPYAGDGIGFHAVPSIGSGVWIEFEAGNPDYPIWSGGWWPSEQIPSDEEGNQARPPLKILRSETGLLMSLDDKETTITLSDANGENLLTIEAANGLVRILAAAKTVVRSPLIELAENAPHPVVLGDLLLTYLNQVVSLFNTHVHPGELAGTVPVTPTPPVPPFPPAEPKLLSTKVKTG